MFDFHTHILPGVDDGSGSVEESLSMLRALKEQGVSGVAATPHFYANRLSPADFFEKRRQAWELLKPHLTPELPEIRLGAEVQYFEGIQYYDGLERFCMEGTDLLLLEMPGGVWTKRMISAVAELQSRGTMTVVLAHVERYLRQQKKEVWDLFSALGVRLQISTDVFLRPLSRRTALGLLSSGKIHYLGSDCHNMTSRKPNMAQAAAVICGKNCGAFLQRMGVPHSQPSFETGGAAL